MSFWSRERRAKELDEAPPTVAAPPPTGLAVVEFWAADHRTVAGLDLSRERLTDLVNREESLSVVLLDVGPEDPSQMVELRPGQSWSQLRVQDSLLILPPPQPANPMRRLHRPRQPVEVLIGPFIVTGMAHVPPGAQAAGFLVRQNTRFAAVTRAAIRDGSLTGFQQRAQVVLVNMQRIEAIRDIGLDEADALVPPEGTAPIS